MALIFLVDTLKRVCQIYLSPGIEYSNFQYNHKIDKIMNQKLNYDGVQHRKLWTCLQILLSIITSFLLYCLPFPDPWVPTSRVHKPPHQWKMPRFGPSEIYYFKWKGDILISCPMFLLVVYVKPRPEWSVYHINLCVRAFKTLLLT